jgi:prevent-host-death family protein
MAQSRRPVKKINAMKARQTFGQLLEEVYYQDAQYIIERAGKPMAAVVPLSHLEELQKHHGQEKTGSVMIKGDKRQSKKRRA